MTSHCEHSAKILHGLDYQDEELSCSDKTSWVVVSALVTRMLF